MAAEDRYKLRYGVTDVPPLTTAIFFGFQQVMVCASGIISNPLIITNLLCATENAAARVQLIGTTMFVTGFSTFIQTTFGTRLPMLQGPSISFLPPIIAMTKMPQFQCPDAGNFTNTSDSEMEILMNDAWLERIQIVQGGLISSAVIELLMGLTGIVGVITKFVGPLTIAPLMVCLEITIAQVALKYVSEHWISVVTIVLLLLTALFLHQIQVPFPKFDIKTKKFGVVWFPFFAVFPYLIAIGLVWILCAIFTETDIFDRTSNRAARTDLQSIIADSPWFTWPYPCQWGPLNFHVGIFLGMVAATVTSVVESIGDYQACAVACVQPPPPSHAVNRGIAMEGLCCIFGGLVGAGVSVTTYTANIGVIGITKVASRRMMQIAGIIFLILGVLTKVGAVLATIPNPVIGGALTIACGMVGGVGLSCIHTVDLRLSRNAAVLGLSIIFGILIPSYIEQYPINTGITSLDQMLNILLGIQMFVGGISGFILDNTVPGATKEQRGLVHHTDDQNTRKSTDAYLFNPIIAKFLSKFPLVRYMPFLPSPKLSVIAPTITESSLITKL